MRQHRKEMRLPCCRGRGSDSGGSGRGGGGDSGSNTTTPQSFDDRINNAYDRVKGDGFLVAIADLRREVNPRSREEFDQRLKDMQLEGKMVLTSADFPEDLRRRGISEADGISIDGYIRDFVMRRRR